MEILEGVGAFAQAIVIIATDRSFSSSIPALLLRAQFPIIKLEHWGLHGKEAAEAASCRESCCRRF